MGTLVTCELATRGLDFKNLRAPSELGNGPHELDEIQVSRNIACSTV
jgi:hypothetical protein